MTITFNNPGELDLNCIRLMGVSVKNDGAIGYFGTGLKYAIATFLRSGHQITLRTGGREYAFQTLEIIVRGVKKNVVYMNEEQLGFTTDLGRNWKTWMAFREIYSNMLDEQGWVNGSAGETSIEISGPEIDQLYADRHETFLENNSLLFQNKELEIYKGATSTLFYRGVRVMDYEVASPVTFNILRDTTLTEDRTLSYIYSTGGWLGAQIKGLPSESLLNLILGHDFEKDWNIHYNAGVPSAEFSEVGRKKVLGGTQSAVLRAAITPTLSPAEIYPQIELNPIERRTLDLACKLLSEKLSVKINRETLYIVEHLDGAYGWYDPTKDVIVISRQTLANGRNFTAATLFEEWVHKTHRYADCTRELQQYLFDRLIATAELI